MNHQLIWVIVMLFFLVLEALTYQIVGIWFVIGAAFTALVSIFVQSMEIQISVFFVVSIALLLSTRPIAMRVLIKKPTPTNADTIIGETGIVTKRIGDLNTTGEVRVKGQNWTALSEGGEAAEEGQRVCVVRIEGVKVIVKKIEEDL